MGDFRAGQSLICDKKRTVEIQYSTFFIQGRDKIVWNSDGGLCRCSCTSDARVERFVFLCVGTFEHFKFRRMWPLGAFVIFNMSFC